jgi:hypothetical protein
MKLLVIGQGAWASKIQSVFNTSASGIEVLSVSARFALENPSQINAMTRDSEVVWICTKPEWQLKLLPELNKFGGKLILEKPYIIDEFSFNQLSQFTEKFNGVLQISEPWTYSSIWSKAKKELRELRKAEITIKRGGFTGHAFVSAAMDWLPHDINLLFDLYGSELLHSKVSDIHWRNNLSEVQFQVSVGSEITFTLRVGEFQAERVALWESNDLTVNFGESTLTKGAIDTTIIQEVNPFILQVNANGQDFSKRAQKQLEVQNYFFQKLFA